MLLAADKHSGSRKGVHVGYTLAAMQHSFALALLL
jgi:hypothetical protein